MDTLRTNDWLSDRLANLWRAYFSDVEKPNDVYVRFGRKSRARLGSICQERSGELKGASIITISGYMRSPEVPEYVVEAVLAHELCHYTHGFHSPLKRLCRYPHQGGIVGIELTKRGLGETMKAEKRWVKANWEALTRKEKHA